MTRTDMALLPAPGAPDALYLLDLPGLARGSFHTAKPMMAPSGEPVAVTAGVIGTLTRILRRQDPAYLAFCAETGGPTFRHGLYPAYRAGHGAPSAEYAIQLDRVREILALHRIPVLEADGFSAGDLFATAASRARAAGLRTVIVSKSQEAWQLIRDGEVMAWDGQRDLGVGEEEVRAAFHGVSPALLPDLLALAGRGDEAPGVPGIGEKTAARLVQKHGALAEVLRKWQWETGKLMQALRDHAADADPDGVRHLRSVDRAPRLQGRKDARTGDLGADRSRSAQQGGLRDGPPSRGGRRRHDCRSPRSVG